MVKQQHRYADAARSLGFYEMAIFSYPVETDTVSELSKRLDGVIAALEAEDIVIMQLPTENGYHYEKRLFDKIKSYRNTKIVLLFHDTEYFSERVTQEINKNYMDLCRRADVVILPTGNERARFQKEGIKELLFGDDVQTANIASEDHIGFNHKEELISEGYLDLCRNDFYIKKLLMDAIDKLYAYDKDLSLIAGTKEEDEIQIGFGLYDKSGNYSVWVGVAMQSIIENTNSKICFHILIDSSVSKENMNKLIQVATAGGQKISFHLLQNDIFNSVEQQMKNYTVGAMFRVMLPEILPEISKIIYLDADILANRDIKELWDINIEEFCLAAAIDVDVVSGLVRPVAVKRNEVLPKRYFNSGVLYMNLERIRKKSNMRKGILDYLERTKESDLPDQDALNAIYNDETLLLDATWNCFVRPIQTRGDRELKKCIYHYVGTRCILYSLSAVDRLYYEVSGRTPWGRQSCREQMTKDLRRMNERFLQLEKLVREISDSYKKYVFYGEENAAIRNMYNLLGVREGDYRVVLNPINGNNDILPCKNISFLEEEREEFIVFVRPEADNGTSVSRLEQMGLVKEKDFFVIPQILPVESGGYL